MKYQEALNKLKPNGHDVIHHEDGWWSRQNDAINSMQELVDKAIPKKPIEVRLPKRWGGSYLSCPTCRSGLTNGRCCSNNDCRQAIDWSKDE